MTDKFDYIPYLNKPTLDAFSNLLLDLQHIIHEGLSDYPNFLGIQFVDVSAGGIQIRGFHKDVDGHNYGEQTTIKYDMSNAYEAASDFISYWKASDNDDSIRFMKEFFKQCEEYGYD